MPSLKMALPKGHLWEAVKGLLDQAGYNLSVKGERSYRVESRDRDLDIRIHRAQNISLLVEQGRYDIGVTGLDWVLEPNADVEELADLKVGRVSVVAAVPERYGIGEEAGPQVFERFKEKLFEEKRGKAVVASEYENLTRGLFEKHMPNVPYRFIRSYGATETFIEVADLIVDCTETGATLRENGWRIIHRLFESTARMIGNRESLKDPWKREKIAGLVSLIEGARDARGVRLLKMNVQEECMGGVMKVLPAMKSPTISKLYGGEGTGYAVEVAVNEDQVVQLIPKLKRAGATDILELKIEKVVR
ncbi:MAG: ATP phosphoribosyltransferase [Candidatus Bathyarchaeia archaeon]